MENNKMYQVSTLQALSLGYTKSVINVLELKKNGNTGLGTYEGVNGEMIMIDGNAYRAKENGDIEKATDDMGVPFASVSNFKADKKFEVGEFKSIDELKMKNGIGWVDKINSIEIRLPMEPGFDTYALKGASEDDIKKVEQGKK